MSEISKYADWLNETVIDIIDIQNKEFLNNLWDEVTNGTPVATGLTKYSWRMTPSVKSNYKPQPHTEMISLDKEGRGEYKRIRAFPDPERPHIFSSRRNFKKYVMFNNQDYVFELNENSSKPYYQFIENGIDKAIQKSKK